MQTALPFRSIPSVVAAGPLGVRDFADRLVRQSQARPDDRILIVGGGRCGLILELYRRGFTQVCHETGDRLPAHETFDVVWLLRVESAPALARVLGGLGRILRPGGTIVAWTTSPSPSGGEGLCAEEPYTQEPCAQNLRQRFAAGGLVPLVQASDGGSGWLLTAHRPAAGAASWPATA